MSYGVYRVSESDLGLTLSEIMEQRAVEQDGKPVLQHPSDVYRLCRRMAGLKQERLVGLYLDAQNRLLHKQVISVGSLNMTHSHPREILHPAITHLALGFIMVHNHPSGTLVPSSDDIEFTRKISRAGEMMGIPLYDHVIVGRKGFVSLKEKGLLV